jgi:hypothetical protein
MLMPETTVNLNNFHQSWEHEIRSSRELVNVESVAEAHPMHEPPHCHLR